MDKRCSLKKPWCDVLHFGRAAAGQNGQHGIVVLQAQLGTGRAAVGLHRNHTSQGMAHIGGRDAVLLQQRRLKREDAQDMVGSTADFFNAIGAPCPDGRADKMHGFNACCTQIGLQPQIEIRGIHADEDIRAIPEQPLAQLLANCQQLAQPSQHLHAVAMHGELLAGPPGSKTPALHLRATNAAGLQPRPMGLHAVDQQACQQVTRCLARHHGDAGGCLHGVRLSARCRAWHRPGTAPSSPPRPRPAAPIARVLRWQRGRPPM